jgi:hypothetical protein
MFKLDGYLAAIAKKEAEEDKTKGDDKGAEGEKGANTKV